MGLQDDLQQLDEELSAGRLSAEDYRRRRDQLVANSQENPQPPDGASGEYYPEPAGQQQESPFPPAFRWETSAPDDTQVIQPVQDQSGAEQSSETTQVMPRPQAAGPPPTGEDAERTQVVPGAGPPVPAPQPSAAEPPWAQGYDSDPPWSGVDLPPAPEQQPDWMLPGPAESEKSPALVILSVVGAVLVLGAIAFGSYWLWGRDGASTPEATATEATQAPVQNTEPPKPPDPLQPADVGGLKENKNVRDFDDVIRVGFLTADEIVAYQSAGAGQSRLLITNFDEGKVVILVTEVLSPQQAITLRDEVTALQETYGFELQPPTRAGVPIVEIPETATDAQTIIRGHYAGGSVVVRVEMTGADPRATTSRYQDVLDQQLQALPADG